MFSLNIFVSEMVTYIKNAEARFAKVGKNVRYLELAIAHPAVCGLRSATVCLLTVASPVGNRRDVLVSPADCATVLNLASLR